MNIHLHIERLILDGVLVERNQASHVQAAVEAELSRLLSAHGLAADLQGGGAVPNVRANGIQLADDNPIQIGTQVAQSVYTGIGNNR